jgi:DNA-binding transcriptional MerR regulator/methylmalonyl-CoA mutase cobalamin-binding subunit
MRKSYPIKVVARRSGLSPEVLRVWEKRYGVISPSRSESGRRLYSAADIEKLRLLQQLTRCGRRIGELVGSTVQELRDLLEEERSLGARPPAEGTGQRWIEPCLVAIRNLDGGRLRSLLERALVSLDGPAFTDELLGPLFHRLGEEWEHGRLEPRFEHLASSTARAILGQVMGSSSGEGAPRMLVATPRGQRHEIGALMVGFSAGLLGFRVVYFGTDLPAADIVSAVHKVGAVAVALSIVYPPDDPDLAQELLALATDMPGDVLVILGGRSAPSYEPRLRGTNVRIVAGLSEFRGILRNWGAEQVRETERPALGESA